MAARSARSHSAPAPPDRSGEPVADLERQIDEIYQQPLAAFTSARNALAKTLAGAGAKTDAARVKALPKPTVVPWAVNQVFWHARSIWDRLIEAGAAVRHAQIAAIERPGATATQSQHVRDRLRDATIAHRQAVADAAHQAVRAAAQAHASPQTDHLTRMLDAVSLAPELPGPPGRLTDVVLPAGFEALLGVTPAASPVFPPPGSPAGRRGAHPVEVERARPGQRRGRDPRAEAEAERARRERLQAATERVNRARADEAAAQSAEAQAQAALEDAELRVTQARAVLATARTTARSATAARERAEADLTRHDAHR